MGIESGVLFAFGALLCWAFGDFLFSVQQEKLAMLSLWLLLE